jgi:uncharacterized protein
MFRQSVLRMTDETLEILVRQYLGSHDKGVVTFAWQGGEPTLMGLGFFKRALELQRKYCRSGIVVENTLQTNGTLLDDEWCRFLHDNRFLVGLSIDGPSSLHDAYRKDKKGKPTSGSVVHASKLLHKYQVEFNTLTVVNRKNAQHPLKVYRFLRNIIGARYMQFIPCVEPKGFETTPPKSCSVGDVPSADDMTVRPEANGSVVTDWSVDPEDYGKFLNGVFDEWIGKDVGEVFVINFEAALGSWLGIPPTTCTFAETCGDALAFEHDGSVYSCDHYVYPEHRLGSIRESSLAEMASSQLQIRFGKEKADGLPSYCRDCDVLFACRGECPKNRFVKSPGGEPGLNYLCNGLRRFFLHIDPWMKLMADEIRIGGSAENVMRLYNAQNGRPPEVIASQHMGAKKS